MVLRYTLLIIHFPKVEYVPIWYLMLPVNWDLCSCNRKVG